MVLVLVLKDGIRKLAKAKRKPGVAVCLLHNMPAHRTICARLARAAYQTWFANRSQKDVKDKHGRPYTRGTTGASTLRCIKIFHRAHNDNGVLLHVHRQMRAVSMEQRADKTLSYRFASFASASGRMRRLSFCKSVPSTPARCIFLFSRS